MLGGRGYIQLYAFKNIGVSYCTCTRNKFSQSTFYSTFSGRREGVCKKSTLCMLVKMLKIMDGPLSNCMCTHVLLRVTYSVWNKVINLLPMMFV